jgi:uncharacterized protein
LLFRLPKGLVPYFIFSEIYYTKKALSFLLTPYLTLIATLLSFLVALHLYFILVRKGFIPHFFPRSHKREFLSIVKEITSNKEFAKLKNYQHHTNHIYDHLLRVAYISYTIAKSLKLDYVSATRGALLHDFFLYDWREKKRTDDKRSSHGKEHPYIALANATKHFEINDVEADIIVKHMFPKTKQLPFYKESYLVSLADKMATVAEYLGLFKKRLTALLTF